MNRRYKGIPWWGWMLGIVFVIGIFAWIIGQMINQPVENTALDSPPLAPAPPQFPPSNVDQTPAALVSCAGSNHISWSDAESHLNEKVAVVGPVNNVQSNPDGSATVTIGTGERKPLSVVINTQAVNQLPVKPAALYGNQTVCVIGVAQAVGAQIQMVIDQPSDISVYGAMASPTTTP